jgi:hypothetical protein
MFCTRCECFISNWSQAAANYGTADGGQITWLPYSETLYKSINVLQESSGQGCSICRNAWHTLTTYEQADLDVESTVVLEVKPDQGRPVLKVNFLRPNGTSLTRMVAMFFKQDVSPDVSAIIRECGSVERTSTGSESSFKLASFWLSHCIQGHSKCPKSHGFLPTRVIDVDAFDGNDDVRLVETAELTPTDKARPFVALSHCWGKDHFLITKLATLEDHKKNIPLDTLPPSFQDAVVVVRQMGFKYIWIDSLCIIQDSAEDWQKESRQMCNIYAQAIFTITSAHASGAYGGMFRHRDGIRTMPFEIELQLPSKPICILYVPTPQREVQWQLNDLPIYSRAWCFQEMVLSTRNLIFDPDGIRWECLTTAGAEGNLEANSIRHSGNIKLIQGSMKEPTSAVDFFDTLAAEDIPMQATIWQSIIKDYAARSLTKYTDKLIAFAGIAQEIEKHTDNKYLAGLWQRHLFMNLIWYVQTMAEPEAGIHAWFPDRGKLPYRKPDAIAPSWSWASVNLPVEYDTYVQQEQFCDILSAEVDGPPHVQSGKLAIRGDVRELYVLHPDNSRVTSLVKLANEYQFKDSYGLMRRLFAPSEVMLATIEPPSTLSRSQILPVIWQPEDIWDEQKPITFLTITRHPVISGMPLDLRRQLIYTLALLPAGNGSDDYRRIGLAVWQDCSWFGYDCAEDKEAKAGAWKKLARSWGRVKPPVLCGDGGHVHPVAHDPLPTGIVYHSTAKTQRRTLHII